MTVSKELIQARTFTCIEFQEEKVSYHVNDADMSRFMSQNKILALKIAEIKLNYENTNNLGSNKSYDELEEVCRISVSTMKKTIKGTIKPTRNFLYKLTVGLKMSLDQANDLFSMCGGPLTDQCMADLICIKALEDGDSIDHFIEQVQHYTGIKLELRERVSAK